MSILVQANKLNLFLIQRKKIKRMTKNSSVALIVFFFSKKCERAKCAHISYDF